MKILVTGHLGFIGSHVYEYFTSQGHYVEGYDIPFDLGDFKTKKNLILLYILQMLQFVKQSKILMPSGKTMLRNPYQYLNIVGRIM